MKQALLITFGCSWTFGIGAGYVEGMSDSDYRELHENIEFADQLSFRAVLSEKFNLLNRNFASGGSSNQRQFRLAKNFFISKEFSELQKKYDNVIVLWGITSTARNECYRLTDKRYYNFLYNLKPENNWPLPEMFVKYSYDHDSLVDELAAEISHWNEFFKYKNIKNLWFDTFNHYDYLGFEKKLDNQHKIEYENVKGIDWPTWENYRIGNFAGINREIIDEIQKFPIDFMTSILEENESRYRNINLDNLIFQELNPRDLMSLLAKQYGLNDVDKQYHKSIWRKDTNRVDFLVSKKILNPYSYHPTKLGHQIIADVLAPFIEKLI